MPPVSLSVLAPPCTLSVTSPNCLSQGVAFRRQYFAAYCYKLRVRKKKLGGVDREVLV